MRDKILDQLVQGEFIKIERHASHKLRYHLPDGHMDADDAMAWMRFYALEAVKMFDLERGTPFGNFLWSHLRNRSLVMWRRAWSATQRPPRGFCSFTELAVDAPAPAQLEITELMESLTGTTRSTLRMILHYHTRDLRDAFTKRTYKSEVNKKVGIKKEDVERFVQELRQKIPNHLSTVEV